VIQPLIVRADPTHPGDWQIVAGERRWRGAQLAQVDSVPIVIRHLDDAEVLEIAILENVQRTDLNPIEEAAGYAQLVERFGHTQEKLAAAMGKSRSYIANALRLLTLPESVQALTRDGRLSAGHARALVTAPNAEFLARSIVDRGLSVRDTERLVKSRDGERDQSKAIAGQRKDPDTQALESDLGAALGLAVTIKQRGAGGELRITYENLDQLDGLCQLLHR
jgi:ParB family chromosome partitioning protein